MKKILIYWIILATIIYAIFSLRSGGFAVIHWASDIQAAWLINTGLMLPIAILVYVLEKIIE